jgi:YesN/AraC family two-component response regulator
MNLNWPIWLKSLFAGNTDRSGTHGHDTGHPDYIVHRLDVFMATRKPYLQPRYTIRELSQDIKIPAYQLSSVINLRKGMNFSDYLNQLRIRYCQKLVQSGNRKVNVRDLPTGCGFRNRNSFTIAFKKFTGMTPSEYLKKH